MIKYIIYTAVVIIVLAGIFGGGYFIRTGLKNKKEMTPFLDKDIKLNNNLGRVIVVYYSLSGKTKDIAQRIQAQTGGDIYEVRTSAPMPGGAALYVESKKQLTSGNYPQIEGPLPDFNNYDTVFIGAPIWWYRAATPLLAFLQQADFKGKKVAAFSTQGSNSGTFSEDIKNNAKNAVLLPFGSFNNMPAKYNKALDNKISDWLNSL